MSAKKTLLFSKWILGACATEALQHKLVSQTIRSQKFLDETKLECGDIVQVALQRVPLNTERFPEGYVADYIGNVKIASITPVNLGELEALDVVRGGFLSLLQLQNALRRAGWRYKALSCFSAYCVTFGWVQPDEKFLNESALACVKL